jgi:hypothetical protein
MITWYQYLSFGNLLLFQSVSYYLFATVKNLRDEMAKHYQIASVLYDVLKAVVPDHTIDAQV